MLNVTNIPDRYSMLENLLAPVLTIQDLFNIWQFKYLENVWPVLIIIYLQHSNTVSRLTRDQVDPCVQIIITTDHTHTHARCRTTWKKRCFQGLYCKKIPHTSSINITYCNGRVRGKYMRIFKVLDFTVRVVIFYYDRVRENFGHLHNNNIFIWIKFLLFWTRRHLVRRLRQLRILLTIFDRLNDQVPVNIHA